MTIPKVFRYSALFVGILGVVWFRGFSAHETVRDSIFPVPDILAPNVAFWKRIYSEVSLNEGLFHDREFPSIVYKKISLAGRNESSIINETKNEVVALLTRIAKTPVDSLSVADKQFRDQLRKVYGDSGIDSAASRVRFQRGQADRFKAGLERSGAYIDTIRKVFTQKGIPLRVAFLPHVESSFNPEAYSKVGAAGLWQFMRSTGKLFLTVNYLIDERRDPLLSTEAASKLLKENYDALQSWPLAITAYNHGVNGMKRAVEATGSRDFSVILKKYESRSFQFASRNFYACFLAASEIAMNPEQYFGHIAYAKPISVQKMILPQFIDATALCSSLKLTHEEFLAYNPALREVVFDKRKKIPAGYAIRIPAFKSVEDIQRVITSMPAIARSDTSATEHYYQVARGENLVAIAAKTGVGVVDLATQNNLTADKGLVAGQVLSLPPKEIAANSNPKQKNASNSAPQVGAQQVMPKSDLTRASSEKVSFAIDSTSPAKVVPETRRADARSFDKKSEFDAGVYNLEAVALDNERASIHMAVDETVGHIAEWLGCSLEKLRALNRIGRNGSVRLGQKILIPADSARLEQFSTNRLEYHMALEEDFYATYRIADVVFLPLKKGENLWTLCNGEDPIPLWLFKKYNKDLDLVNLLPGVSIAIPVIIEKTEEEKRSMPSSYEAIKLFKPESYPKNRLWKFSP